MKSFGSSMSSSSSTSSSNHHHHHHHHHLAATTGAASSASSAANLLHSFRSNLEAAAAGMDSTTLSATFGGGTTTAAAATNSSNGRSLIPHQGALCRLVLDDNATDSTSSSSSAAPAVVYGIEIGLPHDDDNSNHNNNNRYRSLPSLVHELRFSAHDFDVCQKLFAILDTESRGAVDRATVQEFVTLRCPVFCRRDDDLRRAQEQEQAQSGATTNLAMMATTRRIYSNNNPTIANTSPTFDEVWKSVVESSKTPEMRLTQEDLLQRVELGVEAWMVFCRFIALAQYLEAKRRFSARHLQQTMRHRNSPRGSEVVVVDVPPPEPPAPLSPAQLAVYERKSRTPLPLPELDLDHSLVAAHDAARRRFARSSHYPGRVKIRLFGSSSMHHHHHHHHHSHHHSNPMAAAASPAGSAASNVEFKITYIKNSHYAATDDDDDGSTSSEDAPIVVRRSMEDMKWLNDTFTSHNVLGGTLCGRILPPFPGTNGRMILAAQFQRDDTLLNSSIKHTTGGAIAAAAAGVEIIKDVAKSIWKSQLQLPSSTSNSATNNNTGGNNAGGPSSSDHDHHHHHNHHAKKKSSRKSKNKPPSWCLALPESYYNPNSPAGKARQIERYLNYLLEHPALSTSFPLNTILKASQSGLEAAKQSLEECLRVSKEVREQTPQLVDGKTILPFWGLSSTQPSSLSWVRTAAQAAMALKVHGILETTGMQSASARLQHASLPNFDHPVGRNLDWVDEEQPDDQAMANGSRCDIPDAEALTASDRASSFEQGVVTVQSELQAEVRPPNDDDGYDLLPLPIPAPERRILSAGSRTHHQGDASFVSSGQGGSVDSRETRFHYGTPSLRRRFPVDDDDDSRSAFLGDISVDEHIDKLREVIGSVDNTLSRCLASSGGIGRARRERLALHLDIVQGFDSWKGLRGKFIGQRALLKGVSGIEQSNEDYVESDLALIDDVSWQTALASSAVHAAEDVRSAVRAARTAENAKAAASAAAMTAQTACDSGTFPTIDEARAAQTRASIAQSHAFHAAVVEHEAKAVKRRATLALAHDVKCWNVHRKREMLKACIAHARSQHQATRRAVDAWSCLRDGFIGSSIIPPAQTRKAPPTMPQGTYDQMPVDNKKKTTRKSFTKSINRSANVQSNSAPSGPVDLLSADVFSDLLDMSFPSTAPSGASSSPGNSNRATSSSYEAGGSIEEISFSCIERSEAPPQSNSEHEEVTATIYQDLGSKSGNGKPVIVAVDHNILTGSPSHQPQLSLLPPSSMSLSLAETKTSDHHSDSKFSDSDNEILPFAEPVFPLVTAAPLEEVTMSRSAPALVSEEEPQIVTNVMEERKAAVVGGRASSDDNEIMSASMQSLVDGLMTWGGQFEAEDVLALPTGMAASIAFEESEALGRDEDSFE